jgi:hypothetical protein
VGNDDMSEVNMSGALNAISDLYILKRDSFNYEQYKENNEQSI